MTLDQTPEEEDRNSYDAPERRNEDANRFQLLSEIFERARSITKSSRHVLLNEACGEDGELRAEIESLLREHDDDTGAFSNSELAGGLRVDLDDPDHPLHPAPSIDLGTEIESYRIVRVLGKGGMGTVYEAEQEKPRRRVALKVIRPGIASPDLVRRFEIEWQILGRLDHIGIAKIFEAGTASTEAGVVPFFAMELVDGESLLKHSLARGLDLRARIELMTQVCDAVEHAHRRGVIHRDLKPENILVNTDAQPKVLDFGVARAVDADVRATMQTSAGELVGTVTYMSPEQASGVSTDVDTRSDVYALGVIAYELLTGKLPYALETKTIPAAVRTICEEEPTPPAEFDARCDGDIDAMLLMALDKEPDRRYQSPAAFADDLRRYIRSEPIAARRPTGLYRLAKLARRHKALVCAIVITVLALLGGTAISTWMAVEAAEQEDIAVKNSIAASRYAKEAQDQADEARRERDLAIWESAKASLRVAGANLEPIAQRHRTAIHRLESVPEKHRAWEWNYLRSRVRTLVGHKRMVKQVEFSPTGAHLLTLARDGVGIWQIATQSRVAHFKGPRAGSAEDLAFSHDGTLLCIAFSGERLTLRSSDDPKVAKTIENAPDNALCVAFSPDGKLFAAGSADGTITLWDMKSLGRICSWKGHTDDVLDLRFDASGRRLASASRDRTVRVWDAANGDSLVDPFLGHGDTVRRVDFNQDGSRIASSAWDGTTRLWNATSGESVAVLGNLPGRSVIPGFAFSPDGTLLAATSGLAIALVDARTGERRRTMTGHRTTVLDLAYSHDGERLYSSSYKGDIREWNGSTGEPLGVAGRDSAWVTEIEISPDDGSIAATGNENCVRLFDSKRTRSDRIQAHLNYATTVEFSADGSWFATGGLGGEVRVWCSTTLEQITSFKLGSFVDTIYDVDVSPDGTRIAAVANRPSGMSRRMTGDTAAVWDTATGERLLDLPEPSLTIKYSPDGEWLATCVEGTVRILDANSGELLRELSGHTKWVYNLAFSPDGSMIASASGDRTARVWTCRTGEEVFVSKRETNYVHTVAFDPSSSIFAYAGRTDRIRLRDLRNAKTIASIPARSGYVDALCFLPHEDRLVSGGYDGSLRFWSLTRKEPVFEVFPHDTAILRIALSPDATRFATVSMDGSARILDNRPAAIQSAERTAVRHAREIARPLVERLLEEKKSRAVVAKHLRGGNALEATVRAEALKELLRRKS